MKRRLVLVIVAVLVLGAVVAGAWVAPRLLDDPGYVLIEVAGWRLQMSFFVLVAVVLGVWLLTSLGVGVLRMPGRALRRFRSMRQRRNLDRGLLALSTGDWQLAERSLERAMRDGSIGTAGYLAAARAAQGQSSMDRRDHYLALADDRAGGHALGRGFATHLVRARMLMDEGQYAGAIEVLEKLHLRRPRQETVLKLLLQCYQQCDRWHDVRLLLPAMRRAGIIDRARAEELAALSLAREMSGLENVAQLEQAWRSAGRTVRGRQEVLQAYAGRALELDRADLAEPVLRRALDEAADADLLALYSKADSTDIGARIAQCEKWLELESESEPESPALHLALGRLYLERRDDDKALAHLQTAVKSSSDPAAHAALGQLMDRTGRIEAAAQCYRNALRLNEGRAPEPLPLPVSPAGGQDAATDSR
ncbi:MAG: heme biosynthesis HemY N-terminal domain-containing protein [Wenzhouxiangellaceae bacterium]